MQRYFISKDQINNQMIQIVGEDVHHLKNVLRSLIGDKLICCDGQGFDYLTQIKNITSTNVECTIIERLASRGEPKVKVTIAQSMPKREKFEWILQKGTEIGATRFIPFQSSRTLMKLDGKKVDQKVHRWEKIVKEAAEQAHRGVVPIVESPKSWKEMLDVVQGVDSVFLAYEKGGEALSTRLKSMTLKEVFVMIGPEGGFTEKEVSEAREAGATPISLGPRILRTETAPLVLLSSILYHSGDI